MKFKQLELILGPTSIEDLYYSQCVDDDTLAEAMLRNWDDHGSLVGKDESWTLLNELSDNFIIDDVLNEYNSYKSTAYRTLVIKVKNRYFAYYYTENPYDNDCYEWEEVKPIPTVSYEVRYVSPNSGRTHFVEKSDAYSRIFN